MLYVVEYSQSQKAFHISTFQERLVNEITCAINGVVSDYKVIQEFDTYDEASDFVQETLMEGLGRNKIFPNIFKCLYLIIRGARLTANAKKV